MIRRPPRSTLFPSRRSSDLALPLTAWFFHEEPIDRPAGAVHEHVGPSERLDGELDGGRDGLHVGYVRLAGDDRSARSLRLNPLGLLQVDVGDQDTRSLGCKTKTDRAPQVGRAAGDDHNAALQPKVHSVPSQMIS